MQVWCQEPRGWPLEQAPSPQVPLVQLALPPGSPAEVLQERVAVRAQAPGVPQSHQRSN